MPIDVYASEPHFADHLKPIYDALGDPGDFITSRALLEQVGNRWNSTEETDPTRPVLVASYGDQKKMRHRGRTKIARIEHGAGQSYLTGHGSYAGGNDADDVSLFLTPNEYSANLWRTRYPKAQVEVVGCPKLASLPAKDTSPLTVAVAFHWDCHLVPETVSAFSTFRFALDELSKAVNLIGHGHPRAMVGPPSLQRRYRRLGIPVIPDFDAVCSKADLFIADNTSALYEFAATGRPVVVLNSTHYRKDFHPGLRFWDLIPGPQVDRPSDLVDVVQSTLGTKPYVDVMAQVYAHPDATQRAAAVLDTWS